MSMANPVEVESVVAKRERESRSKKLNREAKN